MERERERERERNGEIYRERERGMWREGNGKDNANEIANDKEG